MATDYKKAYAANPFGQSNPSNPSAWLGWYLPLDRDYFATIEAKFKSTSKAFDRFAEFESVRFAKGVKRAMLDRLDILAPRDEVKKRRGRKKSMTKQQLCRFTGLCSRAANLATVTGQAMALAHLDQFMPLEDAHSE